MANSFYNLHKDFSLLSDPTPFDILDYIAICARNFLCYYSSYYQKGNTNRLPIATDLYTSYFEPDNQKAIFINITKMFDNGSLEEGYISSGDQSCHISLFINGINDEIEFMKRYSLSYNRFRVLISQLQCWTLEAYSNLTYKQILDYVSCRGNQEKLCNLIDDALKGPLGDYDISLSAYVADTITNEALNYIQSKSVTNTTQVQTKAVTATKSYQNKIDDKEDQKDSKFWEAVIVFSLLGILVLWILKSI